MRERRFREDLFYRLNVVSIELPALRERGEDVLLLAHHLLGKHGSRLGKPGMRFATEALRRWPATTSRATFASSENAIERAANHDQRRSGHAAGAAGRSCGRRGGSSSSRLRVAVELSLSFNEARQRFERTYIDQVLEDSGGNLSQAARRSGMDRSNFRRLLERHGVRGAANVA